ncbi:MAG: cytidylate kinase-like family protein [Desulfobacteraceae bacterium]|nr:MAG: cytidylate kinase-like family protein [Desulfobacteraceae bacterium]
MSIITISRGSYSRGKEVAETLAKKLGYDCISRDILLEASEEFNIPEIQLVRAIHDAPSVLERFTHGKERYIRYIRKALLQHVQKDNVVYHGLAGHFFLQNIPHVFKIRIIADMEERVKEEVRRENISAEKALYVLKKDDDERRKWGLQLYGIDTWDSRLYDLVLHIKTITMEDASDMIYQMIQTRVFQTTPESRKILDDLLLSAKVEAALVTVAPTIRVTADAGVVYIGNVEAPVTVKHNVMAEIRTLAEKVEGVEKAVLGLQEKKDEHRNVNPFHNI